MKYIELFEEFSAKNIVIDTIEFREEDQTVSMKNVIFIMHHCNIPRGEWKAARDFIESMCTEKEKWRFPTINELPAMAKHACSTKDKTFVMGPRIYYWGMQYSYSQSRSESWALTVTMDDTAHVQNRNVSNNFYCRPVRDLTPEELHRFRGAIPAKKFNI